MDRHICLSIGFTCHLSGYCIEKAGALVNLILYKLLKEKRKIWKEAKPKEHRKEKNTV